MYRPTKWVDHIEGIQEGTDQSAANFNNIEAGVIEANAIGAMNSAYQRYAADVANNTAVAVIEKTLTIGSTAEVEIPAAMARNTADYNVTHMIINDESGGGASVAITGRIATAFAAYPYCQSGSGEVTVRFFISGGMI